MSRVRFLLVVFVVAFESISFSCDPCALYSALNTNQGKAGSFNVSVFEQTTRFEKGNDDDYYSIKNGEIIKNYSTTQVNLSYGISENFSLQVSVPYVIRTFDKISNFRGESASDSGFGDASILTQFQDKFELGEGIKLFPVLYAGLKLPTGDTGSLGSVTGSKHHTITGAVGAGRVLTFGSGSYDVPLGGSLTLTKDRALLTIGAQYTIRTEGSFNYKFANDLFWYTNPGYFVFLDDDFSLSLTAFLSGENKGADKQLDQRVSLSSFSNIFLGPSMGFSYKGNLTGELAYQRRMTDKDNSIIVPEDRLRVALSYRF